MRTGREPDGFAVDAAALYEQERDRIYRLCLAMLHDPGDAEDAVQETFTRVTEKLDRLGGDPVGYAVVVARNVCRDELRRRSRAVRAAPLAPDRSERPAEDTAVDRGLLRMIWRHLAGPERSLFASAFSGLSLAEIAQSNGTSVDVAAQRLSRARRRMRRLVAAPAAVLLPIGRAQALGLLRRLGSLSGQGSGSLFMRSEHAQLVLAPLLMGLLLWAATSPAGLTPMRPVAPPSALGHSGGAPLAVAPVTHGSQLPVNASVPSAQHAAPAPSAATHAVSRAAADVGIPPPVQDQFTSFTPSPDYANDHTVFGAANPASCTGYPQCGSLWRSTDGGHDWQMLSAMALDMFTVLLPPSYPRDSTIFALSALGLYRSGDGGHTFVPVVPIGGIIGAVDPTSSPGDTRIMIANWDGSSGPHMLLYHDRQHYSTPLATLPPGVMTIYSMFSAPGAGAVYVDTWDNSVGGTELYACVASQRCGRVGGAPAFSQATVSPTFAADHTYFTSQVEPNTLVIATIGGATTRVPLGALVAQAIVPAADYAISHRVDVVASYADASGRTHYAAVQTVRAGPPVATPMTVTLNMNPATMTRLPDGRLLVSAMLSPLNQPVSLLCSPDDGQTWAPTC